MFSIGLAPLLNYPVTLIRAHGDYISSSSSHKSFPSLQGLLVWVLVFCLGVCSFVPRSIGTNFINLFSSKNEEKMRNLTLFIHTALHVREVLLKEITL